MDGKKVDSREICRFVGTLGEIGNPPFYFYEIKAARILGCSLVELRNQTDRAELMSEAFSFERGVNEGEMLLNQNKQYWRMVKAAQAEVEKAKK